MRLGGLVETNRFGLELCTPADPRVLESRVAWVTTNELIDPTPFLSGSDLLVITGMGLNVRDRRTWDAYVERLVDAGVAALAFRVGLAHDSIPDALRDAAIAQGLPLLRVPRETQFAAIEQFVAERNRAEDESALDISWRLAERLAQAVSAGSDLGHLLALIGHSLDARVGILDGSGGLLAEWAPPGEPDASRLQGSGMQQVLLHVTGLPVHTLVVRRASGWPISATPLAPVASIISLYLERRLADPAHQSPSWLSRLEDQLSGWDAPAHAIARTLSSAELSLNVPVSIAIGRIDPNALPETFSIRLWLSDLFDTVRVVARGTTFFMLLRPSSEELVASTVELVRQRRQDLPVVFSPPTTDPEELRTFYLLARSALRTTDGPMQTSPFGLLGLVVAGAGRSAKQAASRFLASVVEFDEAHGSSLLETLRVYLERDGKPGLTAAQLHIHRNTLSYRLRKLESLLGVSLDSVAGQAECLVALQFLDSSPASS